MKKIKSYKILFTVEGYKRKFLKLIEAYNKKDAIKNLLMLTKNKKTTIEELKTI